MGKLRAIADGYDNGRGGRDVASPRPSPIAIDEVFPITTDPKEYLEGRVAFYIALLERLVGVGADRGDPYFVKECIDALLKMTNIGRAKMDVNMTGTLSKLRDEIDFTKMQKDDLAAFVEKARGEIDVRSGNRMGDDIDVVGDVLGSGDSGIGDKKPRRKRKKQHNYADARNANHPASGGDSGEAGPANAGDDAGRGAEDSPDSDSHSG